MSADSQYEDSVSDLLLENIKHRLLSAFRVTSAQREPPASWSLSTNPRADQELRRAKIDGAITWLRTELLEMRSQDRELAKTLLELNREIQKLRNEQEFCRNVRSESPSELRDPEIQTSRQPDKEGEQELLSSRSSREQTDRF
ncbi:alanine and arginine-rich domain-containing protein [Hemiscyllium ocellatum]|uniref:alanine and arginine-rich domain-containing protein n=1 Tax=Hemiscyllium ocellatum TaxID=170820 RepID=UPI002965D022|nr:alanine and arginine-rich domain-containing protein [Hemiscyllium ocellatum]